MRVIVALRVDERCLGAGVRRSAFHMVVVNEGRDGYAKAGSFWKREILIAPNATARSQRAHAHSVKAGEGGG